MSESDSLDLSAEDLMPSWVSDLGQSRAPSPAADRRSDRDDEKRDRGGKKGPRDRNKQGFDRGSGRGKGRGRDKDRKSRYDRKDSRRPERPQRADEIVPQVDFVVEPTQEAVTALAKHIRSTNRAYAMAEVAQMVLAAGDRYKVVFRVKSGKQEDPEKGKARRDRQTGTFRMVRCKIDDSVWLSREEAVAHFLNTPELLNEFYEVEEVETGSPKGNFSVIAVCGMSGAFLGPPNHHEYQQNIASLHRERFGNMPLEKFKSRIEMRRDEETIEQWKEQMSTSRHYRVRTEKPGDIAKGQVPVVEEEVKVETDEETPSAEEALETETIATEESDPSAEKVTLTGETSGEPVDQTSDEEADEAEPPADEQSEESETKGSEETEPGEGEAAEPEDDSEETDSAGEDEPAEAFEDDQDDSAAKTTAESEPAITSMTELTRHFREHFARQIFKEVSEARLPGTVSKKELSPALSDRMNAEINWQKRGFPLPMVRALCRRFEHQGLKFFKRGKKALFVSATRPRALAESTVLTDRLLQMLDYIKEHPGTLAGDLVKHLLGDAEGKTSTSSKDKGEDAAVDDKKTSKKPLEPTKKELALLADLRWLLEEGYLIEFPSSELLPGTEVSVDKRKRRAPKRSKKKQRAKKAASPSTNPEAQKSNPGAPSPPLAVDSEPGQ